MRLNLKILFLTTLVLMISLSISSVVNVLSFRTNYTEALLTGSFGIGHSINSVLNEMLALGLPIDSLSGMDARLNDVMEQNTHIAYIGIATLDGVAIFHSDPGLIGKKFTDQVMQNCVRSQEPLWQYYNRFDGNSYYDVAIPVFDADKHHVGVIRLGFSRSVVDEKVMEAITATVINLLVTFVVIALLLNFFLRRFISQPVELLSDYAQHIAVGEFGLPVKISNRDELGDLSTSLNHMAANLRQHIAALEDSREKLEIEVEERTRELADANATLQSNNITLTEGIQREQKLADQAYQSELALRESEERFRRMFEDSGDALLLIDGTQFIECNQAVLEMLRCQSKEQIIGRHPWELSPAIQQDEQESRPKAEAIIATALANGSTRFEWLHQRMNGEVFPVEVLLTPINYHGKLLLHVVWRDISERKRAEQQIHSLAFYDPLTGLANRRLFLDRLEQTRISSARTKTFAALMLLDLDNFKTLNDTHGHDLGDQLLIQVGERLQQSVRQRDTISRLGGDEFVVMLDDLGGDEQLAIQSIERVAEKIRVALLKPYPLSGQSEGYNISCSIGMTLFDGENDSAELLLKHADLSLYKAKEAGRNTICFYDPKMQAFVDARAQLERELHRAIKEQEFDLYYQPLVDNEGGLHGVEALLRWHPQTGMVPANKFIDLAEENGLILPLGYQVLESVCHQIKRWSQQPQTASLTVGVNITTRQLHHPHFVEQVSAILQRIEIDPKRLCFEITESTVQSDPLNTLAKMLALRDLGLSFSLDDFGTGCSSLFNLKQLPITQLKIDRSFVWDISDDPNDAAIIQAILGMAESLGISVIAKGVETSVQRDFLLQHGCRLFQGYLYARPMPLDELEKSFSLV